MNFENATFRIDGKEIGTCSVRVNDVCVDQAPPFDHWETGVEGSARGTYEVEFTMSGDYPLLYVLLERRVVTCRRCGLGRIYPSERRALKAMASRWTQHVCPRGRHGRWITHRPNDVGPRGAR